MTAKSGTLLAWHSRNHGFEVLTNAIDLLRRSGHPIARVLYLCRKTEPVQLKDGWSGPPLEVITLSIKDPSNHAEIYAALTSGVVPIVQGESDLHVNVSPGTPAMHSVWLLLHAGGAFPAGTRLWSSQREAKDGPVRLDAVRFPITTYLSEIRLAASVRGPRAQFDPEAKSPARRRALEDVKRYASVAGAPLLILGERGTGKTRLVETLVSDIKRRKRVVTVPCGALDSSLAESELFGHIKGAFTGAESSRTGLIANANGGILFLDEVQDLPKAVQRKLIRFFQDREHRYRQVGGDKELSSDVEVVCASNVTLTQLSERLDPDLFDRLSHLVAELPPLRECREDVHDDWARVWTEFRRTDDLPEAAPWSQSLAKAVAEHPLPGNLRELQRLSVLIAAWWPGTSTDKAIEQGLAAWTSSTPQRADGSSVPMWGRGTRRTRIREYQRGLALWAKDRYGTWARAAKALGCDERTLRDDAGP